MFAYVTFGLAQSDLSPIFVLIVALMALVNLAWGVEKKFFFQAMGSLMVLFFVALFTGSTATIKFAASLVLITALLINSRVDVSEKIQLRFAVVWLLTGLITLRDPSTFAALLYRVGADETRGALGLTPEPSLYGLCSVFYMAYAVANISNEKDLLSVNRSTVAALFFGTAALLSQSMFAYMVAFIVLIALRCRLILVVASVTAVAVISAFFSGSRASSLLTMLMSLDFDRLLTDSSIAYRLGAFLTIRAGQDWDAGEAQAAGISALFVSLPFAVACISAIFLSASAPIRQAVVSQGRSAAGLTILCILMFVGPIAIAPYWLFISRRGRYA